MKQLKGNVTLITGGGKGIGFGLAQAFASEGSDLVITGRTESRLVSAKERLENEYGIKVLPIVADGADEDAIKNVVAKTIATFGKINTNIHGKTLIWPYTQVFMQHSSTCGNVSLTLRRAKALS